MTWTVIPQHWASDPYGPAELGEAGDLQFIIEFFSDSGLSDEDCGGDFLVGPFGCDEVEYVVDGTPARSWGFEGGLEGWTPGVCAPVGTFVDIVDVGNFEILDPCYCKLEGNVIECAAEDPPGSGNYVHPDRQLVGLTSPIVNFGNSNLKTVLIQVDVYGELPWENGVGFGLGCWYYPFFCEITGATTWSQFIRPPWYQFFDIAPLCATYGFNYTDLAMIPSNVQQMVATIEVISDCDSFGITNCSGVTNFTPIFDNIVIAEVGAPTSPTVDFD